MGRDTILDVKERYSDEQVFYRVIQYSSTHEHGTILYVGLFGIQVICINISLKHPTSSPRGSKGHIVA